MGRKIIKTITVLPVLFWVFLYSSCYYDVEQELYPASACNTENINYSDSVVRLLELHGCVGCHNDLLASGGVNLSTYQEVKIYVDNGRLLGSIKHEDGYSAMPQGAPQIPSCDIAQIEAWISEGAPNN